ncbi:archease [Methanococcoides sp. AM1]|uniref:archease n=1 Tax=Methanococcoides sp. AM1 TaxID=1201011 RepID=UPI001082EBD0|nr:archease [Methanococcoides sp. AM1]
MQFPDLKYEYLEHTADAKFKAYGKTMEEAFENAAVAMFNVMINTSKVDCKHTESIKLTAPDIDDLLVDWLSELLFLFEVDFIAFGEFKVESITQVDGEYTISAHASGEEIDLGKHEIDTEVKAVTYNDLKAEEVPEGFMVQVTVDT